MSRSTFPVLGRTVALHAVVAAGAAVSLLLRFEDVFATRLHEGCGLSETSPAASFHPFEGPPRRGTGPGPQRAAYSSRTGTRSVRSKTRAKSSAECAPAVWEAPASSRVRTIVSLPRKTALISAV